MTQAIVTTPVQGRGAARGGFIRFDSEADAQIHIDNASDYLKRISRVYVLKDSGVIVKLPTH